MDRRKQMARKGSRALAAPEPATFWRRGAAFAFDWYVGALVTSLPIALIGSSIGKSATDTLITTFPAPWGLWAGAAGLAAGVLYYVLVSCVLRGQTLGKRLFHVRIARASDGGRVCVGSVVLRQLVGMMVVEGAVVGTSTVLRNLVEILLGASSSIWPLAASYAITIASVAIFAFRSDHRALHDLIAGTTVVDDL